MLARNGDHYLDFIYGTLWAGGVINPVNIRWSAREIAYSLQNCATRILFIGQDFLPMLEEIRSQAPSLVHVIPIDADDGLDEWVGSGTAVADAMGKGDDLAAILYTGGTTGFPKGAMLSHRNLMASALGAAAVADQVAGSRYLHSAPLFHVGALSGLFISMLAPSRQIFIPAFEPLAVLETVAREGVDDLFLVPTMIRMLIDHPRFAEFDMSGIGRIRYGAASIDDALLDRALEAFPNAGFWQAYGMTELSPVATILAPEDHKEEARRQGRGRSAGRASATTEVRIVDSEDCEVARGEVGEIVVRGETVMQGYWNMPDQTAEALRGGWMHTGDLGRMDDEGYVTVVDRLKDMIISGGENVYSAEVENLLALHPGVDQAAVIGIPHSLWGETVHAVIVARNPALSVADLDAYCRQNLAGYKVPRSFALVESLPLSPAGKVLKNQLRDEWRNRPNER